MHTTTLVVSAFALALLPDPVTAQRDYATLELEGRPPLEYALVLPDGYDPADTGRVYPTLIALPPGDQTRGMVEAGLGIYWEVAAKQSGWIVVSPAATGGKAFFEGDGKDLAALMDHVAAEHRVEGGLFHLAGVSNGGRGAFHQALAAPERFASITVLPGFLDETGRKRAASLAHLPVSLYVGGDDAEWLRESHATHDALVAAGDTQVELVVFEGEGHQPKSATPALLFAKLEQHRATVLARLAAEGEVAKVLDALHDAAAKADGPRYFGLYTPDAVFLGTDATERWTLAQLRAYAEPNFRAGKGWSYRPRDRHVFVARSGETAWFDERLDHATYGEVRGTGVLVRQAGAWRVAQYNLAFPVPNDLVRDLGDLIRAEKARQK